MKKEFFNLYKKLKILNVEFNIIITEWVLSLFSSVIPIDLQIEFYFGFFAEGWNFFYKMCIAIISTIEFEKNENIQIEEIYLSMKFGIMYEIKEKKDNDFWKKLIKNAYKLDF